MPKISPKKMIMIVMAIFCVVAIWATVESLKKMRRGKGVSINLPIKAHYPKLPTQNDYLPYRIQYSGEKCLTNQPAIMCLNRNFGRWNGNILHKMSEHSSSKCQAHIVGRCQQDYFSSDIEQVKIPRKHHGIIKEVLNDGKGSITLRVYGDGSVEVENIKISHKTWQEYLNSSRLDR